MVADHVIDLGRKAETWRPDPCEGTPQEICRTGKSSPYSLRKELGSVNKKKAAPGWQLLFYTLHKRKLLFPLKSHDAFDNALVPSLKSSDRKLHDFIDLHIVPVHFLFVYALRNGAPKPIASGDLVLILLRFFAFTISESGNSDLPIPCD